MYKNKLHINMKKKILKRLPLHLKILNYYTLLMTNFKGSIW